MGLYKIEGIVLRRRALGEADRLVTMLSQDRGKITVVAKGARRPRSRFGGRLEPPTRVKALLAEGRSLDVISQVDVIDAYQALRGGLAPMGLTNVVLEMADRALADRHPHPEVYGLLCDALALLSAGVGEMASVWFAARLLAMTGHRPSVDQCTVCGRRIRGQTSWSAVLGGCVDSGCRARDPQAMPLSNGAVALLRFLLDARPPAVRRAHPGPPAKTELGRALRIYAEVTWDTRLRAPAVVHRLLKTEEPRAVVY
jgi:DNA repair protein RecO (recombination protein O)